MDYEREVSDESRESDEVMAQLIQILDHAKAGRSFLGLLELFFTQLAEKLLRDLDALAVAALIARVTIVELFLAYFV